MQEKEDNETLRNCLKIEFPDPEEYVICADIYRHTHATWYLLLTQPLLIWFLSLYRKW